VPTIPIPSRTYAAAERFQTIAVTVPTTVVEASVTLNLSTAQLQSPVTDVEGIIEWAPAGTSDGSPLWSVLASTRLIGHALNRAGLVPRIAITPAAMSQLQGQLVRAAIVNRAASSITFAATGVFS
jgi:hypothetical protein